MSEILWKFPWAFLLLPMPLLVYLIAPPVRVSTERALRVPDLAPFQKLDDTTTLARSPRRWLPVFLLALMWVTLVSAVARPQSLGEPLGTPVSGRDLLLGIDISGSMRERDLYAGDRPATRMAVVKAVAQDFISRRTGDRIGLIMFGSAAYVQTPLTFDHATVQHFLDEATVGLAGRQTAIGDAVGLGVKRLRMRPSESRVMILLTDGENSAGVVDPIEAANVAAKVGIRIHTIGVGSDPGSQSILGLNVGGRRSELDEESLQRIASLTGGRYFRARNAADLEQIYREIEQLEPALSDSDDFRPLIELFAWPLSAALLLSMAWAALRWYETSGRSVSFRIGRVS